LVAVLLVARAVLAVAGDAGGGKDGVGDDALADGTSRKQVATEHICSGVGGARYTGYTGGMAISIIASASIASIAHGARPLSSHAVGVGVGRARLAGQSKVLLSKLVRVADITRSVILVKR
jgi:hypothetical protein